jgi:predicted permease
MGDIKYTLRTLLRTPGYSVVALLTLALGIGATIAMFTVVNGVLLTPLPYSSPDRLVRVYQTSGELGESAGAVSPVDFADWREASGTMESLAGYWSGVTTLLGRGDPVEVHATWATADFFDVLGVPVLHGRPLLADDSHATAPVAVVSERLWRTRFDGDPRVVGASLQLRDGTYTIVGVASGALRYPIPANDVWLPQSLITADSHGPQDDRANRYLEVIGRLTPGVTREAAEAEMVGIAGRLAADHGASNRAWDSAKVVPLREVVIGGVDRTLLLVFAVVGVVLLIGCANLANLMLARASGRAREIAVRSALGARRGRIVRQFAVEALALAFAGAALGLALAGVAVTMVTTLSAQTLPRVEDLQVDGTIILFACVVAIVTALLFGTLPALRAAALAPSASLRGRNALGGERSRARGALVVAQVTFAVVLVVGAGLMVRSFNALQSVDPGFDPSRVLTVTMSLNLPAELDGPGATTAYLRGRKERLVEEISGLPGVIAVGSVQRLPLQGAGEPMEFTRPDDASIAVRTDARFVSPGYFAAMGIPLRAGEIFAGRPTGTPPVLISESTAARLWPGEDAVGKTLAARFGEVLVAGVVGDVRQLELASTPHPAVYMPEFYAQRLSTNLVVRTAGDPMAIAGPVRAIVMAADPTQVIRSTMTLEHLLAETLARDRFFMLLFAAFGVLALLLAAVGIYGVLAYAVGQRQQEIGVRMALGARAADVVRMVLASGMALVAAGIAVGLAAAFALSRLMAGLLYGVTTTDPVTFAAVPVLLCLVALAAAYFPARRATRVDPMTVMRSE